MKSQKQEVLDFLQGGRIITPNAAIERFRCFRLAARILELRNDGHRIETIKVKRKSKRTARNITYAAYRLAGG